MSPVMENNCSDAIDVGEVPVIIWLSGIVVENDVCFTSTVVESWLGEME